MLMEACLGGGQEGGAAVDSTPTTWTPEHQLHGAVGLSQGWARALDCAYHLSGTTCDVVA